jgi:hypothetical protein
MIGFGANPIGRSNDGMRELGDRNLKALAASASLC